MLGNVQISPRVPPPARAWPPGPSVRFGLAPEVWVDRPPTDPLAPAREALIEGLYRRTSAAPVVGLGQEREPGQLLVFRSRQATQALQPRSREIAWRRTHERELQELAGQWVILEGDGLIAHGHDAQVLVAAARARGIQVPYLFFVEPSAEDVVKFGL